MAEKRDESSVMFSLRALRAMGPEGAAEGAAESASEGAGRAGASRAPDRRRGPETLDLLADVRASVTAEAQLEAEQRAAAEAARRAESERRIQETSALHRADIEARLAAEAARQRAAAEERAMRARTDRDELGAASVIVGASPTPAPHGAPQERPPVRPIEAAPEPFAPDPPARGRTAFFAIVVGLPVACVTAVALALLARDRGAAPPERPAAVESAGVATPAAARVQASSAPVAA